MDTEFWLSRWREGRTGFHSETVSEALIQHWRAIDAPAGGSVLVPLCGKSLDMAWLASQGHRVLGVELSPLAVSQFFTENKLEPQLDTSSGLPRYRAGDIELIQGNLFDVDAATLDDCAAVYDRAAIVALDATQRERYARQVYGQLPADCRGLMITFEYPPGEMEGPPFSVSEDEIRRLLADAWQVELLERRDILADNPRFTQRGLTALSTAVYRLHKEM